jgi:hypothetical protein
MPHKAWLALWLMIFLLLVAWRTQNLDAFGLSNDEGAHLMWARLTIDGYPLYHETQAVQAPLFIESVGWAFRLGGATIQAGRWTTLLGFGLLAASLSWLAYRAGRWPAALTALLFVGLSPLIFTFSRLVMAEVPATAWAVLSIALAFLFIDSGNRGWLLASGLALGLSFLLKTLNPFVIAPVGLLLLVRHCRSRQRTLANILKGAVLFNKAGRVLWKDWLWWGLGLVLPLAGALLIYDPAALYDQLIAFRGDLRAAVPGSWSETWNEFKRFMSSHWGLWLLALGGVGGQSRALRFQGDSLVPYGQSEALRFQGDSLVPYNLVWLIWLGAGAALLAWHTPLFPHHFIVLLPPLILLGAGAVGKLAGLWPSKRARAETAPNLVDDATKNQTMESSLQAVPPAKASTPTPMVQSLIGFSNGFGRGRRVLALVLVAATMGAVFNGTAMVQANQENAAIVTGGREQEALRLLEAVSNPADFVMGDSQLLIFMAKRRTPPPLGDVALVAIKAGRQTPARMIGLTQTYRSPAVVQWSLRLPWLPEYLDWVQANYLARRVWDNDHIIYFGRRLQAGEVIPNERRVRLGEAITLRGFELETAPVRAGEDLNLTVYWQTDLALESDYTVFTQLLDQQGRLVAGQDSQPLGGYLPTHQWSVGEIVSDLVHLPLPADLPAGEYRLITGMYLLETLERLPTPENEGNYVMLAAVRVEEN